MALNKVDHSSFLPVWLAAWLCGRPLSNWRIGAMLAVAAAGVVVWAAGVSGCVDRDASAGATAPPATQIAASKPATSQPASHPTASQPQDQKLNTELASIMMLIRARKTDAARTALNTYLQQYPSEGKACFLLGLSYHREKRYGEARPWFEKALQLAPGYFVTHHFYGWALYWLGDLPTARREFQTYLESNPTEHDSHFALGLICLDEDDLDCAERLIKRSIELVEKSKPDDKAAVSRARARLGEVYERRGEFAEARRELEQAVTLYPDHYEALYKFYRVLVRLGETERAEQVHKQYLETRERLHPGTRFPE